MSMKLNLKLLSTRFFQAKAEPAAMEDGVNRYLLEHVLRPTLNGDALYLGDIDFDAFDAEDVSTLENYYEGLDQAARTLGQFAQTVDRAPPAPQKTRMFC